MQTLISSVVRLRQRVKCLTEGTCMSNLCFTSFQCSISKWILLGGIVQIRDIVVGFNPVCANIIQILNIFVKIHLKFSIGLAVMSSGKNITLLVGYVWMIASGGFWGFEIFSGDRLCE